MLLLLLHSFGCKAECIGDALLCVVGVNGRQLLLLQLLGVGGVAGLEQLLPQKLLLGQQVGYVGAKEVLCAARAR
eukprot:1156482-Pelagomonas_calceolata.AAC.4